MFLSRIRGLRLHDSTLAWFAAPLAVMVALQAEAAQTGDLRGKITDADGLPVPNAKVTLSGVNLGGDRMATSDDNGRFEFLAIPPGQHLLTVEMGGFRASQIKVVVRLDEAAFVPVTLQPAGSTTEVVVEGELPVIDATRSAVSTELTYDQLSNMPVGRSYQDAVNMIPGVSGRVDTQNGGGGTGNPSVRGEGAYGNNYFVDGISTRDPATKTFGANVNFDAIDAIQVYTDGAPAEFGQFTGMLVNVVTKDGGDEFHGSAQYYLSTSASGGTYDILNPDTGEEEPTNKSKFMSHEISLTAGGPIVKEKLWYFVNLDANPANTSTPEGSETTLKSGGASGFVKLTWFATPDFVLQGQFSGDFTNTNDVDAGPLLTADATSDRKDYGISPVLTARYRPSASAELELKGSYLQSSINIVPASGKDESVPAVQDIVTGQYSNNAINYDYNNRTRLGSSLKWTQLVRGFAGEHKFKLGTEVFRLEESRELIYTGPTDNDGDGRLYYRDDEDGYPCVNPDINSTDCYGYQEYVEVGALAHTGIDSGSFLQDDWRPVENLTLNLGVRLDTESLYNNADEFVGTWLMPAPRAGLAWDVTGDSKTLVSANYGRYYDIAGNDFASWADTKNSAVYRQYVYDPAAGDYALVFEQDPTTDPLVYCTPQSLDDYEQTLLDQGYDKAGAKAERDIADELCGGKLKPYYNEKVVVGIKREIIPLFALGLRGIYSHTKNIPEDVDINLQTWVIANPVGPNGDSAKYREYMALEFTAERKFDDVWSLLASYTLSEAKGHMPGQFELASGGSTGSNGNEVGVYLDDVNDKDTRELYYSAGYGWLLDGLSGLGRLDDDAGYFGYLPYHSFHDIKVNGFYTMPWGTTLGGVIEYDSGHAWQKRGYVELYQDYFAFPEGRGSRFMPAVVYVDLRVAHKITFNENTSLEISVDCFNLPDLKTPISYYENDNDSFGTVLFRQAPRSLRAGAKFTF